MKKYFQKMYSGNQQAYFNKVNEHLKHNEKKMIVTANPEIIMQAQRDKNISEMLLNKDVDIIADGISIVKASKILNYPVDGRIPGVELAEYLIKTANNLNKKVYLFGATEEVLNTLVNRINTNFPHVEIIGIKNGYIKDKKIVIKDIIAKKPDICLVALGVPSQEEFIYSLLDNVKKGVFVGVGGSFDVMSGLKKRAPKIFRKLNLEWAYRIICEPRRIKRFYNNNIKFIRKIIKEKNHYEK